MVVYVPHRLAVPQRRRQAASFSDARICSHDSLRVICGVLSGIGKGFSPRTSVLVPAFSVPPILLNHLSQRLVQGRPISGRSTKELPHRICTTGLPIDTSDLDGP
jgi:hypothetical protein